MIELTVTPKSAVIPGAEASAPRTYTAVTEALAQIPQDNQEPVTIRVMPGTYHEKITLNRPNVHLCGTSAEECIITYDDYAKADMPDGSKRGTFRSYTLFVDADHVTLENLTIRNSSFPRSKAGQAIALYADGDRLNVLSCRLESYQDTLFTGPLPPSPVKPGGFTGPKEFAERRNTKQYYQNCTICGDVDFIFGSATAYFDHCEIVSVCSEELPAAADGSVPVYGYTTAASTPEDVPFGYVFSECHFTSEDCPARSVYLGRPWRDYARTVLLNCYLGEHIRTEGFHDWNKPNARENCFYAEYKSYGPGACSGMSGRADFVRGLSDEEAALYTKARVLA